MRIRVSRRSSLLMLVATALTTTLSYAQHPGPQPRPIDPTFLTVADQKDEVGPDGVVTTKIVSATSPLPAGSSNQLSYVESNIRDGQNPPQEMLNTLPSTPSVPFNLIDGPVQVTNIDKRSPKDDLAQALADIRAAATKGIVDQQKIQFALDILEGNEISGRAYSGLPLLHYNGPTKKKSVVNGNVTIHQVWYDNHIESDTALLDVSSVPNVPWTVTYEIDVLNGGADDFSPFVMYFDHPSVSPPGMPRMPHVAMDATFYPMSEGKKYIIKLKQAPGTYYNLTYTWGWRIHPPRVQVTENVAKTALDDNGVPQNLLWWETSVFGLNPRQDEASKLAAIAQIGELAPAKRIWKALRDACTASPEQVVALMDDATVSFGDWSDRTHLPRGVQADTNSDVTLFYVNNTIYGNARTFNNWNGRGSIFKATLLNGDHFAHAYVNVDFGGSRGWENQFQDAGGPGGSHTFGRVHWWMNTGMPMHPISGKPWMNAITVSPASTDGTGFGKRRVEITLNYDAPQRLKLYQFDPLHHDVAVFSLH